MLVIFLRAYSQCNEFKSEGITKINELILEIENFDSPKLLSSLDLASIVFPEFLTYSDAKNEVELVYLDFNYRLNNKRYKSISFGPFQMQLSFIDFYLSENQNLLKNDSILINYSKGDFNFLMENIAYLNQLSVQWKILLAFERFVVDNYSLYNKDSNFSYFVNIYNSGTPQENNIIFSKITCKNLTYKSWCYEMQNWIKN